MQAIDLLTSRYSAKTLLEPAPDAGALQLIFASAVRAPDHGRLRPWRFIVVRGAARLRFGELLAQHLRRTHAAVSEETLERERAKALRAPLIVIVVARCNPVVKIPVIEQQLSAAAAAHAMMLSAFALGFNCMWKTGAAAYDAVLKAALDLQAADAIVGFLYIGTEGARASVPEPRAWQDLVSYWGE